MNKNEADPDVHSEVTRYEGPGIEERHGIIPTWLGVTYTVMFIWMIWYLIKYWTDKG